MSSHVLVLNAGSSSLKYSLVDAETGAAPATGSVERIGEARGRLQHSTGDGRHTSERRVRRRSRKRCAAALDAFATHGPSLPDAEVAAVGHRVVHGGSRFADPALVDDALIEEVTEAGAPRAAAQRGQPRGAASRPQAVPRRTPGGGLRHRVPPDHAARRVHLRRARGVARGAPDPPLWLPRDLVRLRQPGGRAPPRQTRRRDQPDRPPPGQRGLGRGHPRRSVCRHVDGLHPARGAGHGNPVRRPRPGHPRTPAPRARLVDRRRRQRPQPRLGPEGTHRPQRLPRGPGAARAGRRGRRGWRSTSTPTASASTSGPTSPCSAPSTRWSSPPESASTPPSSGRPSWPASSGSGSRSTRHATPSRSTARRWSPPTPAGCRSSWCRPTRSGRSRRQALAVVRGRH